MTLCAADIRHSARFALRYLLVCVSFVTPLLSACAPVSDLRPTDLGVRVIDGYSLKIYGKNIRLVGFNAPEIRLSRCEYEEELGRRQKPNCKVSSLSQRMSGLTLNVKRMGLLNVTNMGVFWPCFMPMDGMWRRS